MATTTITPQSFLRFAAESWELLVDLFHSQGPKTDKELLQLISRNGRAATQPASVLLQRLKSYGLIEATPDIDNEYELVRFVRDLVAHFLREQNLTSAAAVGGYLEEISDLTDELDEAFQGGIKWAIRRILNSIAETLEDFRRDSRANRDGVTAEVVRLKSSREGITSGERWYTIQRIMERYLEPLRQLIEPKQSMDNNLDRLQRILDQGIFLVMADRDLVAKIRRESVRLERTRRNVREDHAECLREVVPLYASLRRESLMLRGAGEALRRLREGGIEALPIDQLSICSWRAHRLIGEGSLENYVRSIGHYDPEPPPPIEFSLSIHPPRVIERTELISKATQDEPILDLLGWLCQHYADASPSEVLRAYGILLQRNFNQLVLAGVEPKRYPIGHVDLEAWPLKQVR